MKPRILDVFCGAGGTAKGYAAAGFEVVGIDHVLQVNYPFAFHKLEALQTLEDLIGGAWIPIGGGIGARWCLDDFVGVHASPPCQAYSNLSRLDGHPDLIGPTRELLEATGRPYVIENVVGAPLHEPIMLCGSSFTDENGRRLGVERHRLFECNFPIMALPCAHGAQEKRYDIYQRGKWYRGRVAHVWGTGGGKGREHWGEAMGIDWMTDDELAEAIPPAYTQFIGEALMAHLRVEAAA